MADDRDRLPEPTRRAIDALRRLEPPADLLRSVVEEASNTPQRGARPSLAPLLAGLAVASVAALVAVAVLPRLGIPGPGAVPSASHITGVVLRLPVADGTYPASADASSVWLAHDASGLVSRVDVATGTPSGEVQVNDATTEPYSLWPVSDGTSAWAAGRDDRSVVRIDAASVTVSARWPIDAVPYRIAPSGDVLWISDFEGGRVLEVDARDGRILGAVDLASPTGIAVTEGAIYVAGYGGELVVVEPATRTVLARHRIASRATDILAVDGGLLVWGLRNRPLERVDAATGLISASLPGVTGVAVLDGNVWAAVQGGSLALLDSTSLGVRSTITMGEVTTDQLVASTDRLWAFVDVSGSTFLYAVRPDR